jgi:hypothetical protein
MGPSRPERSLWAANLKRSCPLRVNLRPLLPCAERPLRSEEPTPTHKPGMCHNATLVAQGMPSSQVAAFQPRALGYHGQEQEGREGHQVHDPLQHRRPSGAQADRPHQPGRGRQDLLPHPLSASGRPGTIETTATAGMVRPMLASAEPSARFMPVCKRLSRAARKARAAATGAWRSNPAAASAPSGSHTPPAGTGCMPDDRARMPPLARRQAGCRR